MILPVEFKLQFTACPEIRPFKIKEHYFLKQQSFRQDHQLDMVG